MAGDDAWLRAEMGGTTRASVITKPEVVLALIKRAKRPLFIIGHEVTTTAGRESVVLLQFIKGVIQARPITVLGTSHSVRDLISVGIRIDTVMGGMEIIDRLCDPTWKGLDGEGPYDLVFITGFPYSLGWVLLSGLRHGVPDLKTITLDRVYQPHASWSFGNIALEPWQEQLQAIVSLLEKG